MHVIDSNQIDSIRQINTQPLVNNMDSYFFQAVFNVTRDDGQSESWFQLENIDLWQLIS